MFLHHASADPVGNRGSGPHPLIFVRGGVLCRCIYVWWVGEGVQLLCIPYYYQFFSTKHITGNIHTKCTCNFNVHYETIILFLYFPYQNYENDPTSKPLLYKRAFSFSFFFCLELQDLKPFKPKIFWVRTPGPPPWHIYNIKTTTLSVCLYREACNCTKDHFLPTFKAAESVSLSNYCMWIFLCYKKLHMTKLSLRVKLLP